jgi:hypothetical protein
MEEFALANFLKVREAIELQGVLHGFEFAVNLL